MYSLPQKLKKLREQKGVTLAAASMSMGMGTSTLASYESGAREPNLDNLNKLANYYKVDPGDLIRPDLFPNYRAYDLKEFLDREDIEVEGKRLNDREKALIYRVVKAILFVR